MLTLNEYQTPIDDKFFERVPDPDHAGQFIAAPQEVRDQFFEFINSVPYIKWLVSADRPRAKDLKRDEQGRIIVDLARPHILEDMDYFRPAAKHFEEHGCYTFLKPNNNPNSEFGRWIRQERDRCWNGMVRPSDGEWVTGLMYFYLNYCPIMLSKVKKGSSRAERVEDFPRMWEGIYLRFHYLEQARNNGQHAIELARRGCSKSYSLASIMSHNFILGENRDACRRQTTILTAYTKEYLSGKDGTISKFLPIIDHVANTMEFPRNRIKSSMQDFMWQAGYIDVNTGIQKGSLNMVLGVSSKDDSEKLRGKRGWFLVEEMGCHLKGTRVVMHDGTIKAVEEVKCGDVLMGDDGTPRNVLRTMNGIDQMYKITLSNGDVQVVNSKHLIYYIKRNWSKDTDTVMLNTAPELLGLDYSRGYYIPKAKLDFERKDVDIDPYVLGLWLGNGDKSASSIATGDKEVIIKLYMMFPDLHPIKLRNTDKCWNFYIPAKYGLLKAIKNYGMFKNKYIPDDYKYNSKEVRLQLLAGFIDTDGYLNQTKTSCCYEIAQCKEHLCILEGIRFIATSLGLRCTMHTKLANAKAHKPNETYYVLRISGDISMIPVLSAHKKAKSPTTKYKQRRDWSNYTFKIEPYGEGEYYGFEVDGNHLFLLDDLTIVHNCFPNLTTVYNIVRHGVEEGDYTYGMIYLVGTSAEDASDFAAAKSLLYAPTANHIYPIENVFDKVGQGKPQFGFFFPAYVNRLGCMNDDGVSDVTKALLQILMRRYKAKYESNDPSLILKTIAEMPITPAEAIMKVARNMFPVGDLTNRLGQIDSDPAFYDRTYTGELLIRDGKVIYTPSGKQPIREFPHENNRIEGGIEIYEMPQTGNDGKVFSNRYIAAIDPYNNDMSTTMSLGSMFVMDMWTDRVVAEYTGRPQYNDEFCEICRRLALFYDARVNYENNIKSIFSYFSRMNCLYLLTDTLEFLRDKNLVKGPTFGNTSKGTVATAPINQYARSLIREWLIKPVQVTEEEVDKDGKVTEKTNTVPNLYFLRGRALIQELINYNDEGNFDRVSSLGMLMLLREDRMALYQGNMSRAKTETQSGLASDPFFSRYDKEVACHYKKITI